MAASNSDFLSKFICLLTTEPLLQPIKAIVEKTLFTKIPKESPLLPDSDGFYSFHFEGEGYGSPLRKYNKKFAKIYNQLIECNKCYLMHPARRSELIEYLGTTFADAERAADRLITYHLSGDNALKISELEHAIEKDMHELQEVEKQQAALLEQGPRLITNPAELQEEAFARIPNKYCRKYVYLAYQKLASQNKLEILNLSKKKLYKYSGDSDGRVHPDLASLAKAYYNERRPDLHFGAVVKYLKILRNRDLNDLNLYCLNEEKERLQWLIDYYKDQLLDAKKNYQNQLNNLIAKKAEDYNPGDFSFLTDPLTAHILTNAYHAVDRLGVWSFFDIEPPEMGGYAFWDHPMLHKIMSELESDGHSGCSMSFTMCWMRQIRKKGWNVVVCKSLKGSTKNAGVLNRAWAKL